MLGQRQVVRRDQPDRAALEQPADDAFGADEPVVRVRAVEQLVEQEQQRRRPRARSTTRGRGISA